MNLTSIYFEIWIWNFKKYVPTFKYFGISSTKYVSINTCLTDISTAHTACNMLEAYYILYYTTEVYL